MAYLRFISGVFGCIAAVASPVEVPRCSVCIAGYDNCTRQQRVLTIVRLEEPISYKAGSSVNLVGDGCLGMAAVLANVIRPLVGHCYGKVSAIVQFRTLWHTRLAACVPMGNLLSLQYIGMK